MRKVVVALLLSSWVVVVRPGLVNRLKDYSAAQAQHDESLPQMSDVQSLIEALSASFMELRQQQSDSWYSRYDALAKDATNNSAVITELLHISRFALPVIWATAMTSSYVEMHQYFPHASVNVYYPSGGAPAPHPLKVLQTNLLDTNTFIVEVILKTNEEANVGLRLMYEPEEGQDLNFEEGDVLMDAHLRWQRDNCSREVVVNRMYGTVWNPYEIIPGEGNCPNLVVQEKFSMIIVKEGKCLFLGVRTGADRFYPEFSLNNYYYSCPHPNEGAKEEQDPRRLMLVVDEQNAGTGEVEVHNIIWIQTFL